MSESVSEAFARIINDPDLSDDAKMASWLAVLVQQNYNQYAAVMRPLYEQSQREVERLRHELATVRRLVREAFAGPYAPSEEAVIGALYPTAAQLAQPVRP